MSLRGRSVTLHDMCLRDGMHAKAHQLTIEQMVAIALDGVEACWLDDADKAALRGRIERAGVELDPARPQRPVTRTGQRGDEGPTAV